jgi:probable rRNA maturation factor
MIIKIQLRNRQGNEMQKIMPLLRMAARVIFRRSSLDSAITAEISLSLTDNKEIKSLNHRYRGIDKATDVLSFPQENISRCKRDYGDYVLLGDIVISAEKAACQAKDYGHSFEREITFLFVHGLLHLLGYDHDRGEDEALMRSEQRAVLQEVFQNTST